MKGKRAYGEIMPKEMPQHMMPGGKMMPGPMHPGKKKGPQKRAKKPPKY